MSAWKFYVDTYGCKVNQYESQAIAEAWIKLGGERRASPRQADYILINSCAITSKAERDARNAVYHWRREAPGARIILAGCAAQFFGEFKPRKNAIWAEPDYIVPQAQKSLLLAGPPPKREDELTGAWPGFAITSYYRGRPVVKVQDGCSQNCSYCIVPQTRGRPVSIAPQKILAEMRGLLEAGYSELVISGVNLRQYGRDMPEYGDFWDLMAFLDRELAEFAGAARCRISSLEPGQLNDRGLDILLGLKLVCPHIHLSLQHASAPVLRKMGRGHYTAEMVLDAVEKLGAEWQIFGLGADIIAGFPGETEADLNFLLDFLENLPLAYAHVFPYSARQGTAAKGFPGHIIMREKRRRAALIRAVAAKKRQNFWASQLNAPQMLVAADLLPNNAKEGGLRGINEYYVPCHFAVLPEKANARGLLKARPLRLLEDGLEVAIAS